MVALRFGLALAAVLLAPLAGASPAAAQYFGQNKVQYSKFDFRILQTEHFDVHYYPEEKAAALDVARMAERSYARLTRVLNHRFRERKPIIVYASHSDFQQTNATAGEVGEGTGGFTDFLKHRNIFPLTGSYRDNEEVLMHEMVHQFQYDIWSRGRAGGGLQTLIAINPPLWFVEGMAAYLSRGPIDPETSMWVRAAVLNDKLPTIDQMTNDPRIFPYRYGQALISYIGERWGDEAIGAVLTGTLNGGLEGSVRRVLGLSMEQLSQQWRDAMRQKYLPQIANQVRASQVADSLLTKERSDGTLHLAPALSPDGSQVAYFSEKDFYFVDLYLADGKTGEVKRRLLKSSFSSNYETFRFINSQANWSPDGRYLAFVGKRGATDEIIVLDVPRNRQVGRLRVAVDGRPIAGITTPAWSPDGSKLVFTGYDGGLSDLFVIDRDGKNLRRLTNDKYADMHPVWSPDGTTLAFATDRGPETSFETLEFGNFRIALYDLASGGIRLLGQMDRGKNISPQWAPDGRSLAFVSDRDGVSNIFLYDFGDEAVYQLTEFFTGAAGITQLSPVISWASKADRLAFVYFDEENRYNVYTLADPRGRKRRPWQPVPRDSARAIAATTLTVPTPARDTADTGAGAAQAPGAAAAAPQVGEGGTIYRTPQGFRAADALQTPGDTSPAPQPVSIVALLDSATLALPDTSEFAERPYRTRFTPDYVARPSIGYTRDNFGRGVFGGSAISLSDMLGNQQLVFAGYVNGRITEAQVLAAYANYARRMNWAAGVQQDPYFFLEPSEIRENTGGFGDEEYVTNIRRLVVRSIFAQASYPFSRFQRVELGARVSNVDDARLRIVEPFDASSGFATAEPFLEEENLENANYIQPTAALVFDNTLFGYVGPFFGRRYRFEAGYNLGSWKFAQLLGDFRRYDRIIGPVVFATRALYFGRIGRDADQFQIFGGSPDLIRGNTSGSYRRNECSGALDPNTQTGCAALDQLVGTQIAVASAELRFPILPAKFGVPIEGAAFYDVGVVWDENSTVKLSREAGDDPIAVRTPLQTAGLSLRANVLGFVIARFDWNFPIKRPGTGNFWTISLGPTF